MAAESTYRREPTGFDAILGVSALLVTLLDSALLIALLFGGIWLAEWDDAVRPTVYIGFLLAVLLLGLTAETGVVLRCMGADRGLAGRWPPLALVLVRVGWLMVTVPAGLLDWEAWESPALVTIQYLSVPTLLLLILSLVNLTPRRSGG